MKYKDNFSKILRSFFPLSQLDDLGLGEEWRDFATDRQIRLMRFLCPLIAIVYIYHYFVLDQITGNEDFWFYYRFGIVLSVSITFLMSFIDSLRFVFRYRIHVILIGSLAVYLQTYSMIILNDIPIYFSYALILSAISMFSKHVLPSIALCCFLFFIQYDIAVEALEIQKYTRPISLIYSLFALLLFMSLLVGMYQQMSISLYLSNKLKDNERIESIRKQREHSSVLRRFAPPELVRRIDAVSKKYHIDKTLACEQVIRVRKDRFCIVSWKDIRGFTKQTRNDADFKSKVVFPSTKIYTKADTRAHAIVSSQGDLVLSFWDAGDKIDQVKNCLVACYNAFNDLEKYEEKHEVYLYRTVVITASIADVGNMSTISGEVDYTAIGECMNLAQRIDSASKSPQFTKLLSRSTMLLSEDVINLIESCNMPISYRKEALKDLGVDIKDYEDGKYIYLLDIKKNIFFLKSLETKIPDLKNEYDITSPLHDWQ